MVRSITLSSEEHKVIANLDLAEFDGGRATPVDYKHGRPMKSDDGVEVWPSDRVQIAVQGLVGLHRLPIRDRQVAAPLKQKRATIMKRE